ncbi:metallophosphoesterase [Pseudonocardia humida]|uniref:Metallophosphoesterase n=1 Tax=Pseudonocardia humida TaxID=2800819 RepID=A0ABT0ZW07_9PSEU|nr:metallophosphoesterase [Pseudonocardia humida]MCO1654925.1 metallophosphoesterase [Pseudonocardia humida]
MGPTHTLIHITDPHVGPPGGTPRDPVDTGVLLGEALRAVESSGLRPAALVLTGDLVEDGTPEQYRRLRDVVAPVAARLGAATLYAAGNHDRRDALREHLLDRPRTDGPVEHALVVDGLRIVVLDSTVPGAGYGWLDAERLDRLRERLRTPAEHGTVLALHHPPLPSPTPLAAAIALQNPADLATAISGGDVRMILAGHTHVVSAGCLAGVPVWTGGAIGTTLDALAPGAALRSVSGPTVSRVDLFVEGVVATSVPIGLPTAFGVPGDAMEPRIAALRARLPPGA